MEIIFTPDEVEQLTVLAFNTSLKDLRKLQVEGFRKRVRVELRLPKVFKEG